MSLDDVVPALLLLLLLLVGGTTTTGGGSHTTTSTGILSAFPCLSKIFVYFSHCILGNFFMFFLSSADFFSKKHLLGILLECQTVWTLIKLDGSSGLISVHTVCQGYQQTLLDNELRKQFI